MTGIRTFTVRDQDTIEQIARLTTGSAANWQALAAFNNLRAPYFSNDPRDYPGVVLASGLVPGPLNSGATTIPLTNTPASGPNPTLVDPGGTLLLYRQLADGTLQSDALAIASYNAVDAAVAVAGVPRAYPSGTSWYLYAYEQPLKVLRMGDTLLIPDGPDVVVRPTDQLVDLLGTDIALTDDGQLTLAVAQKAVGTATLTASPPPATNLLIPAGLVLVATNGVQFVTTEDVTLPGGGSGSSTVSVLVQSLVTGSAAGIDAHTLTAFLASSTAPVIATTLTAIDNVQPLVGYDGTGDLATTSGLENLRQALIHRLATPQGELPYFPGYGNEAFAYVGMANQYVAQALIEAAVIGCAAQDDRIAAVQGGTIARTADSLTLSLAVLVRALDTRLTLKELQISLLTAAV